MLTLYRKDGVLYGKCIIERLISNEIKNKLNVSKEPQLVETMLLLDILRRNEYVLLETQEIGRASCRERVYVLV